MTSVRFLMGLRTLADPQPHQRKENPQMTDATSTIVNRTLRRLPNAAYRPREYRTEKEVDRLIEVARKRGRNGARDASGNLTGVSAWIASARTLFASLVADRPPGRSLTC